MTADDFVERAGQFGGGVGGAGNVEAHDEVIGAGKDGCGSQPEIVIRIKVCDYPEWNPSFSEVAQLQAGRTSTFDWLTFK